MQKSNECNFPTGTLQPSLRSDFFCVMVMILMIFSFWLFSHRHFLVQCSVLCQTGLKWSNRNCFLFHHWTNTHLWQSCFRRYNTNLSIFHIWFETHYLTPCLVSGGYFSRPEDLFFVTVIFEGFWRGHSERAAKGLSCCRALQQQVSWLWASLSTVVPEAWSQICVYIPNRETQAYLSVVFSKVCLI